MDNDYCSAHRCKLWIKNSEHELIQPKQFRFWYSDTFPGRNVQSFGENKKDAILKGLEERLENYYINTSRQVFFDKLAK